MSKKREAKSSRRAVASLLAASMVLTMLPLSALTASAKPGVDDTLSSDRPTAYNQLARYVDLSSVSAKSGKATIEAGTEGNEVPSKIFDGKTTTKMGINKADNGDHVEVAWQTTEPVTLEYYTLGSGNDSYGRDPKSWVLSASTDGVDYTPISTVENANLNWWTDGVFCSYYPDDYKIESPAAYQYYKIEFTGYRGNEGFFQFSELVMSGTVESWGNPIRYEMEDLIDGGKVAKSNDEIVLNSNSTDANPSGGRYAQVGLKNTGNFVTCTLDNIPASGLYRVTMAVKGNENSATVALAKDYANNPDETGPRLVANATALQLNSFSADVPKVTGEFELSAGADTIDLVGLANCDKNIRPDYIEIQKISGSSIRIDASVANAAGKVTADEGLTLDTSTDNSSPWGGSINMLWVKKGTAGKSVTVSADIPAAGKYQLYFTYKSRETSGSMKVSVNGEEIGQVDCYAERNDSDRTSRGRKYFEPMVGTVSFAESGAASVTFTFMDDTHADSNDGVVFVPGEIILVPLRTAPVEVVPPDVTLPDSLLHYDFADGAKDASGNSYDGIVNNVTIENGIATFAGDKNSDIKIESPVMKGETVTVSAMVKIDTTPARWATLWEAYSNNSNQLVRFAINNDDGKDVVAQFRTVKQDGGGTAYKLASGDTKMPVGEWTELTVVQDGITAILYMNGQELGRVSKPTTPMLFSDLQDEGVTWIGKDPKWNDNAFQGQMSDFRVYDTALTAEQVAALYAENLKEFDLYAGLSAEAAAVAVMIDSLPETTTHRQGPAYREAKAAFDALTDGQKAELGDARTAKLEKAGADLEALYAAFNVEVKANYPNDADGIENNQAWMMKDKVSEEQKQATYAAVADEFRWEYVNQGYLLGRTEATGDGAYQLGNWMGRISMNVNDNAENNDNIGGPDGWAGDGWCNVSVPFAGIAFTFKDVMGVKFPWTWALSNSFEYNGRIYQVSKERTYSYNAGLDLSGKKGLRPADITDEYGLQELENYPGKGRIDWGDMTNGTFPYAFALYNQEHKWENKVVGIPVAGEYLMETNGIKYQRFEGPQGIAYIAGSNEAVAAAKEQNGVKEGAYVVIGDMARALESLGENIEAQLAITGAPVAKAVEADGVTTQKFANGTLKAADGEYSFVSDADLEAIAAVEAKITAAADIANIETLDDLKAKIAEAETAYGELAENLRPAVSNYSTIAGLNKAAADVEAVEQLIADLTAAADVTEANVEEVKTALLSIQSARKALQGYDKFISQASQEKYQAVYAAVSAFGPVDPAIEAVEGLIDAIGEIPEDKGYQSAGKVYAAKNAYEALSTEQQAQVDGTKKAALETAVAKMEEITASMKDTIYGNVLDDTNRWDNSMDPGVWMNANKHTTDESKQAVLNAMRDEAYYQYAREGYDLGFTAKSNTVQPQEGLLYIENEGGDNTPGCNPWSQEGRQWSAVVAPYDGIAFSIKSPFGYLGTRTQMLLGNPFAYNGNVYQLTWNEVHSYAEGSTSKGDIKSDANFPGMGAEAEDITNNTFRYAAARYNQEVKWEGKTLGIPAEAAAVNEGVVYQKFVGPNGEAYIVGDAAAVSGASKDEPTKAAYVVTGAYLEAIKAVNADIATALATTGAPMEEVSENGRWNFTNGYIENGRFTAYTAAEKVEMLIGKVSTEEIADKTTYEAVKAAYEAAKAAYDALEAADQGEVSNSANLTKAAEELTKFEDRQEAADAMRKVLKDLPYQVADIDDAARTAIEEARADYDALDEITKGLVTAEYAGYLVEAEDTVAAADVYDLYKAAPADYETAWADLDPYLESEEYTTIVKPLEEAYTELTGDQVTKLEEAEEGVIDAIEALIAWRPAPDYILGDMNADEKVDISDVMEACKVLARKAANTNPTAEELKRGDMDEDGDIDITDVMEICKILARNAAKA